jgi:hypothetical protein
VLVIDEVGQLGNRQALRVLEISRETGARLILLGDNKQTGVIEQGKAFWLMQRRGNYAAPLGHLDNVAAHKLAKKGPVDCDMLVFGEDKAARRPIRWRLKR